MIIPFLSKTFRLLASLKVAIPLLVALTAVTVVGSLFPTPDLFRTNWYLALLGVLGLPLLQHGESFPWLKKWIIIKQVR